MCEVPLYDALSHELEEVAPLSEDDDKKVGQELATLEPLTNAIFEHRATSLARNCHPVGPYSRTMPRLLWRR